MFKWVGRFLLAITPFLAALALGALFHPLLISRGGAMPDFDLLIDWRSFAAALAPPERPQAAPAQPDRVDRPGVGAPGAGAPGTGERVPGPEPTTHPSAAPVEPAGGAPAAAPGDLPGVATSEPALSIPDCGPPPTRSANMSQYLICKVRSTCLERLIETRRMITNGKAHCEGSGNGHACLSYYESLERQYTPRMCERGVGGGGS